MNIAAVLQRLEAEQTKHAVSALAKPRGPTSFDYGHAVGLQAGLEHAKNTIMEMHREHDERTRNL